MWGLLSALVPRPARADLMEDLDTLRREWTREATAVTRLAPTFLGEAGVATWALPGVESGEGCTTVAVVGSRTVEFAVSSGATELQAIDAKSTVSSEAGLAVLEWCGPERTRARFLAVRFASRRGTIEVLTATGPRPPREARDILSDRSAPSGPPRGDPGPLPVDVPVDARLERAALRARAEGAVQVVHIPLQANESGAGEFGLRLAEGCHRLEIMAVESESLARAPDIDAEIRNALQDQVITRDRADAHDARLDVCLGEATPTIVSYVGGASEGDLVLSVSSWSVPAWIPYAGGPNARAAILSALRRRQAPAPTTAPLVVGLGAQGWTRIPMEVEPGRCYLAAVGIAGGDASGVRLRATVDARSRVEEVPAGPEGGAVGFCSEWSERAWVEVETRGAAPWWSLVVWPMGPEP